MKRNWKTTVFGILSLAMAALKIVNNPETAAQPETIAAVATGVGLIVAKDYDITGGTMK